MAGLSEFNNGHRNGEGSDRIFVASGGGKHQKTVSMPAPSQWVINETVDKYAGVFLGFLMGASAVAIGILLCRDTDA